MNADGVLHECIMSIVVCAEHDHAGDRHADHYEHVFTGIFTSHDKSVMNVMNTHFIVAHDHSARKFVSVRVSFTYACEVPASK